MEHLTDEQLSTNGSDIWSKVNKQKDPKKFSERYTQKSRAYFCIYKKKKIKKKEREKATKCIYP